jgi:hypothetical protein
MWKPAESIGVGGIFRAAKRVGQLGQLEREIQELRKQIQTLRDRLATNSHNSSRPPSTGRPETPRPKSQRRKSGRKPGGQVGHPGRTLSFSDSPQHTQVHPLHQCECGEDLSRQPALDFVRRQANPLTAAQQAAKRRKKSKEQNLLDRLEDYEDHMLVFLWAWEVPFSHNEAERVFRMMKVRLKISGCFRTVEGAGRHARNRSYISTLRKHRLPVLEYLRRALDGRPFLPQAAKAT